MGLIERSVTVVASKKKRVVAFFDSGSSFSFVKSSLINDIGFIKVRNKKTIVEIGDGSTISFSKQVLLEVLMNSNSYFHWFYVGDIPEQMVIGVDFLQKYGHTLEFKNDKIKSKSLHLKNRRGKYVL